MLELIYPVEGIAPAVPAPTSEDAASGHIGEPRSGNGEYFPVVGEEGLVTGRASRNYCHNGSKVLHPVVHLHVIDRSGRLYLQKRSMHKDIQPGRWDTAVGGHVSYGEYLMEALFREAREELGLDGFNPVYLKSYVFESPVERELVNVFAAVGNFVLTPDRDEVEEGRFWTMEEIGESLGKSVFTPNFEGEFAGIRDSLLALL